MSEQTSSKDGETQIVPQSKKTKRQELAFLVGITGISMVFGFGYAVAMAKKKDPNMFIKGVVGAPGGQETAGGLALRALGRATLYSVGGFTLFCFGVCKFMGVKNLEDFRRKSQEAMPVVPKNENQGRNDFKTLKDLADYIISEDEKAKPNSSS